MSDDAVSRNEATHSHTPVRGIPRRRQTGLIHRMNRPRSSCWGCGRGSGCECVWRRRKGLRARVPRPFSQHVGVGGRLGRGRVRVRFECRASMWCGVVFVGC